MGILEEYKSTKNRDILLNASIKMIKDKYNISISDAVLSKIINNIISVISNDAILLNTSVKLSELNNLTLVKIKDFVGRQIKPDKETSEINQITIQTQANITEAPQPSLTPENQSQVIQNTLPNVSIEKRISEDDELLNKLQELEEKRRVANSILLDQSVNDNSSINIFENSINTEDKSNNTIAISSITDNIYKSMVTKKPVNKKTIILNSYDRDWVNQPIRNTLQFNIDIDLQQNIIEPSKILFPTYVKELTPYINMIITDGNKVHKYTFIYHKNNGGWDEWNLVNSNPNQMYFTKKDWKITFMDFLNKDLKLGNDDIQVSEVSIYNDQDNNEGFRVKLLSDKKHHNLERIRKYDDMLLKIYSDKIVNVTVLENNDDCIVLINNDAKLKQEDFINSKLLNLKAQYFLIFSYYAKEP